MSISFTDLAEQNNAGEHKTPTETLQACSLLKLYTLFLLNYIIYIYIILYMNNIIYLSNELKHY